MDHAAKDGAAVEPGEDDAFAGGGSGQIEDSAESFAIGVGDRLLRRPRRHFLADLAREWEVEGKKAEALGMRVVLTRLGVVLAKQGGALPAMMRPMQFFVGGKLGSGQQWLSWVTLEDVIGILGYALKNESVSGAVNVVAPQPVRNEDFTRELARTMHRPALFPAPAFALRLALGQEMADTMLLASQRVEPVRVRQLGYPFLHSDLSSALASVLKAH
jgi:uncharacterized protein (TIGR01777 family)